MLLQRRRDQALGHTASSRNVPFRRSKVEKSVTLAIFDAGRRSWDPPLNRSARHVLRLQASRRPHDCPLQQPPLALRPAVPSGCCALCDRRKDGAGGYPQVTQPEAAVGGGHERGDGTRCRGRSERFKTDKGSKCRRRGDTYLCSHKLFYLWVHKNTAAGGDTSQNRGGGMCTVEKS